MVRLIYKSAFLLVLSLWACKKPTDELFTKLDSKKTGIDFSNDISEVPEFNIFKFANYFHGAGVAAADFDNDGLIDLFFAGNLNQSKLYKNLGDLKFKEVPLPKIEGWATGVSVVDINDDGLMDIYLCKSAAVSNQKRKNEFLINKGNGQFENQAEAMGLADASFSTQAYFLDFDQDGDQDLFLLNHALRNPQTGLNESLKDIDKKYFVNKFYKNDNGFFTEKSAELGFSFSSEKFGSSAAVFDYNADGFLDIYVAYDYGSECELWLNQNGNAFAKHNLDYMSLNTKGLSVSDLNNDGFAEILALDQLPSDYGRRQNNNVWVKKRSAKAHQLPRNTLIWQRPGAASLEVARYAGLAETDWSWCPVDFDFDLDGRQDLFITRGMQHDFAQMDFVRNGMSHQNRVDKAGKMSEPLAVVEQTPALELSPLLYRNTGLLNFQEQAFGADKGILHGALAVDLDNDGDEDLVANAQNQKAWVLKNNTQNKQRLIIKLIASKYSYLSHAVVSVWVKGQLQKKAYQTSGGYLSAKNTPLYFGTHQETEVDSLLVEWPNGKRSFLKNIKTDRQVTVNEQDAVSTIPSQLVKPTSTLGAADTMYWPVNTADTLFCQANKAWFKTAGTLTKLNLDVRDAAVLDIDQNGRNDLAVIVKNKNETEVRFLLQTQQKVWKWAQWPMAKSLKNVSFIKAIDINHDQVLDLVIGQTYGPVVAYAHTLQAQNPFKTAEEIAPAGLWTCAAVADINGDNRDDLLLGNAGFNELENKLPLGYNGSFLLSQNQAKWQPQLSREQYLERFPAEIVHYKSYAAYAESSLPAPAIKRLEIRHMALINSPQGFVMQPLSGMSQCISPARFIVKDINQDGLLDFGLETQPKEDRDYWFFKQPATIVWILNKKKSG